ncbi:hypothetical protein DAPPUDRAFT_247492 [Daphnia pulex]|uniref:RRM domain-containing protein n=1 Tax=Daphnia pulex TaxID=6669 RepID=E9GSI7_DAPPU|nr:hypothetical protein DAPPUDRAFT_247492 [Daphnia pulex]|eukprot:EFX77434.1 hypothetical protein DAPPUDRAFT_247492 [Daphnia pulex]
MVYKGHGSQLTETLNLTCVKPDDLGTRKGTLNTTRQSTVSNHNNYQENNNNLIKKLAEKSNVAAENKILKVELAKLQFELALSENNNRKLEKALDELAASNKSAMEAQILFLEEENIRLIDNQSKSKRIIEHKDRVLEAISLLSSADNIGDEMNNLCDKNLIGTDEKKTEVLRLLAERTEKTITQVTPDVGCEEPDMQPSNDLAICAAPIEVSAAESTDETLVDELCQSTPDSDTCTNLKPSTEEEVQYLLLSNLPPSVHGAEILARLQLMIGQVKQYTMFVDDKGQYTGTMAVAFVHPSDARRAYKTCDGMMFEGEMKLRYKVEVAYYINGQRFYQKEKEPVPTIPPTPVEVSQSTDETSADELDQQTSSDSVDDVISPPAASPSFVDNKKVPDEYLVLSNLPPSVPGAEIVERLQLIIGEVAHYTTFADEQGQYTCTIAVAFVHPSDARRASWDGMFFEGEMDLWYKAEVAYFINGQRSYQKEEEPVPTISPTPVEISQPTDGTSVDELFQPTASDSNNGLISSPSFIETSRKVADQYLHYLVVSDLPPSVHVDEIIEHFELMIGDVAQHTMLADEKGEYYGAMAVAFVHPLDARRAYKTYDVSQPTDETSADELDQQTSSDSVDDVISPPAASPSFVDNKKVPDEYLVLSNLPPSVPGAEIVERLQLIIGEVAHYTTFADEQGQYTCTIAVAFVHPSDARRASWDGMFFEGEMDLWYKAEVAYFINGQRSYQKEEEPVPTISPTPIEISQPTDGTSVDELFQPTASDSNNGLISSPSFIETSRKVADQYLHYLVVSDLPPSVHVDEIIEHFELMIGDVAQHTMLADEKGEYYGAMAVAFFHPLDARRAYKTYDGMLLEGNRIQVAYFINGQRSYQKEEEPLLAATDGVFVAESIISSPTFDHAPIIVPDEALAVHQQSVMQETLPGAVVEEIHQTTTTHLDNSVETLSTLCLARPTLPRLVSKR